MTMQTDYGKFFRDSLVLETPRVALRLMQLSDIDALFDIAAPQELWTYFTKELNKKEELQEWMDDAFAERAAEKRMPFVIIDKEKNAVCGCTSFGNISFYDKRIEIGWTWLGAASIGTGINHHAKFVLLSYAFNALRFERTEMKTDNLNERAKKALVHIGASEEGVLRSHMLMPHGRRRDSIYYSILKEEWDTVKMLYFGDLA